MLVPLEDLDLLTLREGDGDTVTLPVGDSEGLVVGLSLALELRVLNVLEVSVTDVEVDVDGVAVLDDDAAGMVDADGVSDGDRVVDTEGLIVPLEVSLGGISSHGDMLGDVDAESLGALVAASVVDLKVIEYAHVKNDRDSMSWSMCGTNCTSHTTC